MSHYHERKEKVCLNCGAALYGRFCHICGQENVEPKESMFGLISHFLYDITHFDGKFFSTLKLLLTRPGFLSKEYIRGRRASFLHPVRMYVFTSAIFFIIFFAMFHIGGETGQAEASPLDDPGFATLVRLRQAQFNKATSKEDSLDLERVANMLEERGPVKITSKQDSLAVDRVKAILGKGDPVVEPDTAKTRRSKPHINLLWQTRFSTKKAYDSAQQQLPPAQRDGWFKRLSINKQFEINQKLQKDPKGFFYLWLGKLMHLFPQLLFVSLPIFALVLQILYVRHKKYYYGDHGIFAIHLYIFTFIAMLFWFFFVRLQDILDWNWLNFIYFILGLYILGYTYKAMRNFYGQGRFKTFVKYCLLGLMSLIVILFLFAIFFMLSIFQI